MFRIDFKLVFCFLLGVSLILSCSSYRTISSDYGTIVIKESYDGELFHFDMLSRASHPNSEWGRYIILNYSVDSAGDTKRLSTYYESFKELNYDDIGFWSVRGDTLVLEPVYRIDHNSMSAALHKRVHGSPFRKFVYKKGVLYEVDNYYSGTFFESYFDQWTSYYIVLRNKNRLKQILKK